MTTHKFSALFEAAVREWPEIVDLTELQQHQSGNHYIVCGLDRLVEKIESPYIGSKEEVVLRELHWSIFIVIHGLAKSLLKLNLSSIRAEAVEKIFKQRLRAAIDAKDSRWSKEDYTLALSYLED